MRERSSICLTPLKQLLPPARRLLVSAENTEMFADVPVVRGRIRALEMEAVRWLPEGELGLPPS